VAGDSAGAAQEKEKKSTIGKSKMVQIILLYYFIVNGGKEGVCWEG